MKKNILAIKNNLSKTLGSNASNSSCVSDIIRDPKGFLDWQWDCQPCDAPFQPTQPNRTGLESLYLVAEFNSNRLSARDFGLHPVKRPTCQ
jgi:hypothetical protein